MLDETDRRLRADAPAWRRSQSKQRHHPKALAEGPPDPLHRLLKETGDPALEAALCDRYAGLACSLADRYARGGAEREDLRQAAMAALVLALRRFDPDRGFSFTTFAWSTITGELKRFHRSTAWGMRVGRRLQEASLDIAAATEELTHELGRSPTAQELAERIGLSTEQVIDAMAARAASRPFSLDAPVGRDHDHEWQIGSLDDGIAGVEDVDLLRRLLHRLPHKERRLVELRFGEGLSQRDVGRELGISQMHVSRMLVSVTNKLRAWAAASC